MHMLRVYINDGTGEKDYSNYVTSGSISIQHTLNAPSVCTLTMANLNEAFALFPQRSYIRIFSSKYQKSLFTGFLTNDPTRAFLGAGRPTNNGGQIFNFTMEFTSDEYLLNIKSIAPIPAFVNMTQGAILRAIAENLAPGFYDFTYCASGDLVPFLQYDQSKSWSEIAKGFCDSSRYRYRALDKQIHFQPYGDGYLGIEYDEDKPQASFDPSALTTSATTTPIVNDVTIVGTQEAGNNHEDYFIGDGFKGAFALRHKLFGLGTSQNGSSILLGDTWNGQTLNTQNWTAQDPSNNFNYGVDGSQALNVLTGIPQLNGTSYIIANNGLELAGGLSLQHGEIQFNDVCDGIIGGVYDSTILNSFGDYSLDDNKCEAGFSIKPTAAVNVTVSGASGISIRPFRLGAIPAKAFEVITKVNKSYVLSTTITAPTASRYNQVYRTMAGIAYGGNLPDGASTLQGKITWAITETDSYTGQQMFYTFSVDDQLLPKTAVYALFNNRQLNISLTTTYLTAPIPGSLNIACEVGAGLLAPIYISGNVQYTGAFVTPSGGNLPILPDNFGPENNFPLGSSLQNQSAELDSGQITDTLNFYSDDLPGVGVRIRLQSWEGQSAISRVRNQASVALEAAVVGDDGVRASIVSNLSPLPRTSEDCDYAAQAFIHDRINTFYEGTYKANWYFFQPRFPDDIEIFPVVGRYLYVNAPRRNIIKQSFLVTSLTEQVTEMAQEIIAYEISFGPDLFLDRLLAALVPEPTTLLTPVDTVIPPTAQELNTIGENFLPDVMQTTIVAPISGQQFLLSLQDAIPNGSRYEIRNADLNWGINDSRIIAVATATGDMLLPRNAFDQTWFIRFTKNLAGSIITSRRTKVLRIFYPQIPTIPAYVRADSSQLFFDFSGDVRNVEGIELRAQDDTTVYYRAIVGSEFDMDLQLGILRGVLSPGQTSTGPIGQFQYALIPKTARNFVAHFFNLMWEYSPGRAVYVPPPNPPTLREGYRFGSALQVLVTPTDPVQRTDIDHTTLQLATDSSFTPDVMLATIAQQGVQGSVTCNVPATGHIYARAQLTDMISSGAWSQTLFIPKGNLIASDYLTSQGSIPPVISNSSGAPGGLFTYTSTDTSFVVAIPGFNISWPNGRVTTIIPLTNTYITAIYTIGGGWLPVQPSTLYGIFPYLSESDTDHPVLEFGAAYADYTDPALQPLLVQFKDGNVPLTNGPFVVQTAPPGSSGGGGGGGTGGGGNCGEISRKILCADGYRRQLKDINIGDRVITLSGRISYIKTKITMIEKTYMYKTASGLETESALGHVLNRYGTWMSLEQILDSYAFQEQIFVKTELKDNDQIVEIVPGAEGRFICKIELEPVDKSTETDEDHVYNLDGFWAHNIMIKADAM
jgi:hypothetical protein